ncbi:zinc finger protein 425 [Drosophila simulans]|uniref:zinc finger protein 425 n=1 Tax=Drosophila simulans TaxID=7240 RepID=UPI00192D099C|nr:zinc finger protein 425 [Drosophila simulans]
MTRAMENVCQCCKLRPGLSVKRGGSLPKTLCLQCLHLDTFGTKPKVPSHETQTRETVHVEPSLNSEDGLPEHPLYPEVQLVVKEEDALIKKKVIEKNHIHNEEVIGVHPIVDVEVLENHPASNDVILIQDSFDEEVILDPPGNNDVIIIHDSIAEEVILEDHPANNDVIIIQDSVAEEELPVIKEEAIEGEDMQGEYFIITKCLEEPAIGSCRVCLEQSDNLTNIFDDAESGIPIDTTLSQYTGMPVEKGDSFSEYICVTCMDVVKNAFDDLQAKENAIQMYRQPKEEIIDIDSIPVKNEPVDYEVTEKPPHRCPQCPKIFLLAAKLQDHIRTHNETRTTEPPRLKCPKCPSIYMKRGCLEAHMWIHRPYDERESELEPPYRCPHCPKVFLYSSFLKIHIQTHEDVSNRLSRKSSYNCAQCAAVFSDVSSLKDHVKIHAEQRTFECPLCLVSFQEESNLKSHDCAHTRFKCHKCSKFFQSQNYLDYHFKKSHTTKGPFKCIKCQQTFEKRSALKEHISSQVCVQFLRSKSPGQIFPCPKCPKKFSIEANYQMHHATHKKVKTVIEKHNCTQCKKSYQNKKLLTKHILSHNRCVHCPMSFASKYLLKQHTCTHSTQLNGRRRRRSLNVKYNECDESNESDLEP